MCVQVGRGSHMTEDSEVTVLKAHPTSDKSEKKYCDKSEKNAIKIAHMSLH